MVNTRMTKLTPGFRNLESYPQPRLCPFLVTTPQSWSLTPDAWLSPGCLKAVTQSRGHRQLFADLTSTVAEELAHCQLPVLRESLELLFLSSVRRALLLLQALERILPLPWPAPGRCLHPSAP